MSQSLEIQQGLSGKWVDRFMSLAKLISSWSKDTSTQVGAVIVDKRKRVQSIGFNGMPTGVNDDAEQRHERPVKYMFFEHAERNAVYNAQLPVTGSTMFVTSAPCSDCARAIIQTGIEAVVAPKPDLKNETWGAHWANAIIMLREAGVQVVWYEPLS